MGFIRRVLDEDKNHHILVHCVQGISRSASCVIAYLMGPPSNMSLKDAWRHVKQRRAVARPNPAFVPQLGKLELKLNSQLEAATLTVEDVWPKDEACIDLSNLE